MDCWWGGLFYVGIHLEASVGGRFCMLIHCGGRSPAASLGRAGTPPGPALGVGGSWDLFVIVMFF